MTVSEGPLTIAQQKAVAILPIFSAAASVLGSTAVITSVLHEYHRNRINPYLRIMLALSSSDVLSSIIVALDGFVVPAESSDRIWVIGNKTTCIVTATFWQLAVCGVIFYSGYLSFYFLLTIRYGMTAKTFSRRIEPWMHGVAIAWSVGTAIFGATIGLFGEQTFIPGCWIHRQPKGFNKHIRCSSGVLSWIILGAPWFICFVSVCVNNLIIFKYVRSTINRARRHSTTYGANFSREDSCSVDFELDNSAGVSSTQLPSSRVSDKQYLPSSRVLDKQSRRIQEVATQGGFYVLAFTVSTVTYVIARCLQMAGLDASNERQWFPFIVLHQLFVPLQGSMNMIVYLRPKYALCRSRFSDQTRFWAFRRAIFGESVVPATNQCSEQSMPQEDPKPLENCPPWETEIVDLQIVIEISTSINCTTVWLAITSPRKSSCKRIAVSSWFKHKQTNKQTEKPVMHTRYNSSCSFAYMPWWIGGLGLQRPSSKLSSPFTVLL